MNNCPTGQGEKHIRKYTFPSD